MGVISWIFWISCGIVFYNYAGYAILVLLINKLKRRGNKPPANATNLPSITFIVAAYNEQDCIKEKIINSLELDYPAEKIQFLFVTDGSTDNTNGIIRQYPVINLLYTPARNGKSVAVNRAVAEASNEVLIFSDANTILNREAVRHIAAHYNNPTTGGVAGEKKVLPAGDKHDEVGDGEGLYWKYESFLKQLDSDFYSVVGAAGELFSVRRDLYEALPHNIILDDFVLSLKVAQKGYRILYEPGAYAMELPSFSLKDEQKRKVRIAAGGFQSIVLLASLLAFWKQPRLSFLYISHRVLRWTLSPLCLLLAFFSNLFLAGYHSLFTILFCTQLAFYGPGLLAFLFPAIRNRSRIAKFSYYFIFMNVSVIRGFFRFLKGNQAAAWEKARRAQPGLQSE
jgi:biofilm PGA synthesis N-glycosyltransferase PgaC